MLKGNKYYRQEKSEESKMWGSGEQSTGHSLIYITHGTVSRLVLPV